MLQSTSRRLCSPAVLAQLKPTSTNINLLRSCSSQFLRPGPFSQPRPFTQLARARVPTASASHAAPVSHPSLKLRSAYTDTMAHFPHPIYTPEQLAAINISHRRAKGWSDWVALSAVRLLRWGFDLATGYRHAPEGKAPATQFVMTEEKWLTRIIILESIAGVFGMVGGMVRHLHSLRLLRADMGWIETLLDESQNERMHLLTFLEFRKPGWIMRSTILAAQGVFTNLFFISYILSPRTCHRFVGYLEEEAVITYTRAIADLDAGLLPKWNNLKAPDFAKEYFMLEEGKDTMRELLECIRADEAKHREVNHTLANLKQVGDANPFVQTWDGVGPGKGLEKMKAEGWEREEVVVSHPAKIV